MPLKLLPHKSWHVYNQENVARVKRDEARAALEQEQQDDRAFRADAEARLDRLRHKQSTRKRRRKDGDDDDAGAERALQRQLAGKQTRGDHDDEDEAPHANAVIVRPEGWTASGKNPSDATAAAASMTTNGHLNFWAELEAVRTHTPLSSRPGSSAS